MSSPMIWMRSPFPDGEVLVAVQLYPPTRLRVEYLASSLKVCVLLARRNTMGDRPHLPDHDFLVLVVLLVIRVLVQRSR